jgi:hypothetical protein
MKRRSLLAVALLPVALFPIAWAGGLSHSPSAPLSKQIECGHERWDVKTLTDPDADRLEVDNVRRLSVTRLGMLKRPSKAELNSGRAPKERRVYTVKVILDSLPDRKLGFKIEERDSDIHLAVRDKNGSTIIAEFPDSGCTAGAEFRSRMRGAREALVRACDGKPPRGKFRELRGTATITGVLFFDFFHHQRGVSANVAEIHPVLDFESEDCERA